MRRKTAGWLLALGVVAAVVVGCGTLTNRDMVGKLKQEAQSLDTSNYTSKAMMTVSMDNSAQTYYVETWYESPNVYRIKLGDQNKTINQIIVHNQDGMFIVSPALQKVFRFNGNWAQNQGHIYLYDQILQQIINGKDVAVSRQGGTTTFDMPLSSSNDVVAKERVELDSKTLHPKQVILFDKDGKAIVTLKFTDFNTGMKFNAANDFNPVQLVKETKAAQQTFALDTSFGVVVPNDPLGDKLIDMISPEEQDNTLLRYGGVHGFVINEWRPNPGIDGFSDPTTQMVDLLGIPAIYTGTEPAHELVWLNNGVQYAMTSSHLTLDQMQKIAISTFGQTGK